MLREAGARRLKELNTERDRELSDLERRRDIRLSHLRRLATDARTHFEKLAAKNSQAELARREQELPNVYLAARAVPPPAPRPCPRGA